MKIYTSYFAREKTLKNKGIVPIGIAVKPPKAFTGRSLKDLAPRYEMLKLPWNEYTVEFEQILKKLKPAKIVDMLKVMGGGNDVAMLCFEKPGDYCHRHLVAEWLRKAGYEVEEYGERKEPRVFECKPMKGVKS